MKKFLLATLIVSTFISLASAQRSPVTLMQLGKLTESNGSAGDEFGYYAAISGDTAVINRYYNPTDGASMAVDVFVKGSSGWQNMTPTATLAGSDGSVEFYGVAISGNTVVALGFDTSTQTGGTYVFVKPAGGWIGTVTETAVIGVSDYVNISGDTILIGGSGLYDVFVKPAGGWKNTSTPNATLAVPFISQYYESMAIGGNTIVIGESGNFGYQGTVYVYSKPAGGWRGTLNPTATLLASNAHPNDYLGSSVAVSGNTIVAGAVGVNQLAGAVYVYVEPSGGWVDMDETAELTGSSTFELGYSVGISGNAVVAGAPYTTVDFNQFQGAAYVYLKPTGGWKSTSTPTAELTAGDGAAGTDLGWKVGISGGAILATAPYASIGLNGAEGAAYVFGK